MILSPNDLKILACAYFQADASVSVIAKQSGYREHVVRSSLRKMIDGGYIQRSWIINPYAFGLIDYYLMFSLKVQDGEARNRALQAIRDSERVTFFGEFSGDFQHGASVLARRPLEIIRFFDRISEQVGFSVEHKNLSTVLSLTHFTPGYLGLDARASRALSYNCNVEATALDEIDHRVLRGLVESPDASMSSIARLVGIPSTTFDYRVKTLKERGIIVGAAYFLTQSHHVYQHPFAVFVGFARYSAEVRSKVLQFCQKEPNVHYHADVLGRIDCEIGVSFERAHSVNDFVQRFVRMFKDDVSFCFHCSNLRCLKLEFYPFKDFALVRPERVCEASGAKG